MINYKRKEIIIIGIFLIVLLAVVFFIRKERVVILAVPKGLNERLYDRVEAFTVSRGIKVKIIEIDPEKYNSYILESKKLKIDVPDLFLVNNLTLPEFIKEKMVIKVDKKNLEEIMPQFLDGVKFEKRFYGYPYRAKCTMLYYNRNYFEDSMITTEELLNNGGEQYDFVFNPGKLISHYFWFYYFGGRTAAVNDGIEKLYPVLKNEITFLQKNFLFYDEEKTEKQFSSQKVKMYVSDSDYISKINELDFSVDYGTINSDKFKPLFEVESFAVSKKGIVRREVHELAKYLISEESQRYFTDNEWFIPVHKEIFYRQLNKISKECCNIEKGIEILPVNSSSKEFEEKLNYIMIRALKKKENIKQVFVDINFEN